MASSELIQELIRAHVDRNDQRFKTVALQLAAREARAGHRLVAGRIRDLLDEAGVAQQTQAPSATPITRTSEELRSVLAVSYPREKLGDIVLEGALVEVLPRLLEEHRSRDVLEKFGLLPRRRLLLHGPPGCGKTLSASVLAGELGLPLLRVRIETLFSRYLGQTATMLTSIFEEMQRVRGVFLFDEFDALGRARFSASDVGEASRVVSTFLQLVDADESGSLIVAATNGFGEVDSATFRRFDDVVEVPLPSRDALIRLLRLRTTGQPMVAAVIDAVATDLEKLSFAEADRVVIEARKTMVLAGRRRLCRTDLVDAATSVRSRSGALSA
ncbi:MAG: ATP-binding protein [Actinomycetota bacterium]|nr:ATP-binding protein [Actinomycetota bacterium]